MNSNYVSYRQRRDGPEWRVVGEQLATTASAQTYSAAGEAPRAQHAPRIVGKNETPTERGLGFAITAGPFVAVIFALVGGIVMLAFSSYVAFGWFLTGIGSLGMVLLTYVYHRSEQNSPGAADRHWANVEAHKHGNDTAVRLAAIEAEREVRLAAIREYRRMITGGADYDQIELSDGPGSTRQLSG